MDNDQYNHINNAVYYSLFDTLVNTFLATRCPTPPTRAFYVISSSASYHRPASFPAVLRGGMRVAKIGSSSVVYHVAVFDGEGECCVSGEFVHVCVEKDTGMGGATKSRPLPEATRKALEALV
ncbi:HotDog domain-containing protein [Geranomyces variabilis]|nr:HotDog domain-containing protein [Geranomyces variabilis]KAJ3140012.1 hypothetical protein HDU90_008915 [Geranomyces variabilis]